VMTSAELHARFPAYRLPNDTMALFQPDGGYLTPEACIAAHIQAAQKFGAEVHPREQVLNWSESPSGVKVRTSRGTYFAGHLVITAGAWISKLLPQLSRTAIPERQVVAWLRTKSPELFAPARFPVFNLRLDEGHCYGFPEHGRTGFKLGRYHHRHEEVDPDTMDRTANEVDEQLLRSFAERYFPDGGGPALAMQTCLFTNTPDEHFILDFHPECSRVIIGSPCSGHGFKFSSVIGEILADLAQTGQTRHDISMHRMARFTANRSLR